MAKTLAILSYHHIGMSPPVWESWYYVPVEMFRGHLQLLHDRGYQIIGLETLLAGLKDSNLLPERSAVITFDDAYRDIRTEALPVLREFGDPGIVFVPTRYIGKLNEFDYGRQPDSPICDLDDLGALQAGGVEVQSHGVTHGAFSDMAPVRLEREMAESKAVLEAALGNRVRTLAFPFGDGGHDSAVTAELLQRRGYEAAFLYKGGPSSVPAADVYRVPRLDMGPDRDLGAMLETR